MSKKSCFNGLYFFYKKSSGADSSATCVQSEILATANKFAGGAVKSKLCQVRN